MRRTRRWRPARVPLPCQRTSASAVSLFFDVTLERRRLILGRPRAPTRRAVLAEVFLLRLFENGREAFFARSFDVAVDHLTAALETPPPNESHPVGLLQWRAMAHLGVRPLRTRSLCDPASDTLGYLSSSSSQRGDPVSALDDIAQALNLAPSEGKLYLVRGRAYLDLDRPHEALAAFADAERCGCHTIDKQWKAEEMLREKEQLEKSPVVVVVKVRCPSAEPILIALPLESNGGLTPRSGLAGPLRDSWAASVRLERRGPRRVPAPVARRTIRTRAARTPSSWGCVVAFVLTQSRTLLNELECAHAGQGGVRRPRRPGPAPQVRLWRDVVALVHPGLVLRRLVDYVGLLALLAQALTDGSRLTTAPDEMRVRIAPRAPRGVVASCTLVREPSLAIIRCTRRCATQKGECHVEWRRHWQGALAPRVCLSRSTLSLVPPRPLRCLSAISHGQEEQSPLHGTVQAQTVRACPRRRESPPRRADSAPSRSSLLAHSPSGPEPKFSPENNPFAALAGPQPRENGRPPRRSGGAPPPPPPPRAPVGPRASPAPQASIPPLTNGDSTHTPAPAPAVTVDDPRVAESRALLEKGLVAQAFAALSPRDKPAPSPARLARIERLSGCVSRFHTALRAREYDAALREWDGARDAWLERDKAKGAESGAPQPGVPWEGKVWRCEALEGAKRWSELESYSTCVRRCLLRRGSSGLTRPSLFPRRSCGRAPAAPSSRTRCPTARGCSCSARRAVPTGQARRREQGPERDQARRCRDDSEGRVRRARLSLCTLSERTSAR